MITIKKVATLLLFSVIATLPQVASAAFNPDESEQNGLVEKRRNIV